MSDGMTAKDWETWEQIVRACQRVIDRNTNLIYMPKKRAKVIIELNRCLKGQRDITKEAE